MDIVSETKFPSTKIDMEFAEENVIFRISNCSKHKKYCLSLSPVEARDFINRLKTIEKLTWKQLSDLSRKDGLTSEKLDSESFKMIEEADESLKKIAGEHYYFHLRVQKEDKFRLFGYQDKEFFFITHVDPKGKIQH